MDENIYKEVLFDEYCRTCKHKGCSNVEEPCTSCLDKPLNLYSHKPTLWEENENLGGNSMRSLKFIVDGQSIMPDPNCNFEGLVPGTDGYLKAEFTFSSDWDGCVKVVSFFSIFGKEYIPQVLKDGHSCTIPNEALLRREFRVMVTGRHPEKKFTIKTSKLAVCQNGG